MCLSSYQRACTATAPSLLPVDRELCLPVFIPLCSRCALQLILSLQLWNLLLRRCVHQRKWSPSSHTSCWTLCAVTLQHTLFCCSSSCDMDQEAINLFTPCCPSLTDFLLDNISTKKHLARFMGLLLPTVDCEKQKNVLSEAIKYKTGPNFSPG